jgi:hypothetical protein
MRVCQNWNLDKDLGEREAREAREEKRRKRKRRMRDEVRASARGEERKENVFVFVVRECCFFFFFYFFFFSLAFPQQSD